MIPPWNVIPVQVTTTWAHWGCCTVDCLQSAFPLKIHLFLIASSATANYDLIITETRQERRTADSFVVNKPSVSLDWRLVNCTAVDISLTGLWWDCKRSHVSQPTANNSEPSSNLSNKTFKDILQKETAINFLTGNEFKVILPDLK